MVAVDLPGFGGSDKPLGRYDFDLFERTLDGFLAALGIDRSGSRCTTSAGRWACIGHCTARSA